MRTLFNALVFLFIEYFIVLLGTVIVKTLALLNAPAALVIALALVCLTIGVVVFALFVRLMCEEYELNKI